MSTAAQPGWGTPAPRLAGRIVLLEPLAEHHRDSLWEAASDPRIWRFFPAVVGADRGTFDAWLDVSLERSADGVEAAFATVDAASGDPVGSTRFMAIRPEHRVLEIGTTWLAPAAWGSGANTEAKYLMLRHAFEELGALRVEFKTDAANERSCAALAGIGATFEGVFRKHMLVRGGERRDSAWYAVVDDDWPAVRALLERRLMT